MTTCDVVERPILFSGPMVSAILDGRKTQTRRVIKPQPLKSSHYGDVEESDKYPGEWFQWEGGDRGESFTCPYGNVGDRLWVRERFMAESRNTIHYYADGWGYSDCPDSRWKPSIHMPRWASRITLDVTGVRVQRVQDLSYDDAFAEGIPTPRDGCPIEEFAYLWDSINKKRGFEWELNPWVWVIGFRMADGH